MDQTQNVRKIALLVIIMFAGMLMPLQVFCQDDLGSLAGFVYDTDGKEPVKEAIVILKQVPDKNEKKKDLKSFRSQPTGETGDYSIADLPAGTYVAAVKVKSGKLYTTLSLVRIVAGKQIIRSFYLTPERPLAALWKNPCGIAMILAGTALAGYGVFNPAEEDEVSPTTP